MCFSYVYCYFLGLALWYEVVPTCNKDTQLQFILFLLSQAVVPSPWKSKNSINCSTIFALPGCCTISLVLHAHPPTHSYYASIILSLLATFVYDGLRTWMYTCTRLERQRFRRCLCQGVRMTPCLDYELSQVLESIKFSLWCELHGIFVGTSRNN